MQLCRRALPTPLLAVRDNGRLRQRPMPPKSKGIYSCEMAVSQNAYRLKYRFHGFLQVGRDYVTVNHL